jgi:hypothetical protein
VTGAWLPRGDLVEWLALRRISRGGVAMAHGVYFDDGRPFAADLAAVVPSLIDAGRVRLAPVDPWGVRRAALTVPTGCERFAALTAARNVSTTPGPQPGRGAALWALSTFDDRAHAVAQNSSRPIGEHVALCGLVLESSVALHSSPDGSRVCGTCTALAVVEVTR